MKISACYIVRDEAEELVRSIRSLAGFYDELVVVDTGSKDRTRECAAALGARVYRFAWCDDFAAARNFALGKLTGDWAIFLDADEYYTGSVSLRTYLKNLVRNKKSAGEPLDGVMLALYDVSATGEVDQSPLLYCCRLLRVAPEIRYGGRIHEQIGNARGPLTLVRAPRELSLYHTGYQQNERKFRRNLHILEEEIAAEGLQPRHYFYLADCYFGLHDYEKSLFYIQKAIQSPVTYVDSRVKMYHLLIESLREGGHPDAETLAAAEAARAEFPQHAEFAGEAGMCLSALGRLPEAEAALAEAMRLYWSEERKDLIETYLQASSMAIIARRYGEIVEKRGRYDLALLAYHLASALYPGDTRPRALEEKLAAWLPRQLSPSLQTLRENAQAEHDARSFLGLVAILRDRGAEPEEALCLPRSLLLLLAFSGCGLLPFEAAALGEQGRKLWQYYQACAAERKKEEPQVAVQELPLVSVLIPTYNQPEIFRRTMRSAARQTYGNLEIIVNDNSTDERTAAIMADYADDPRVRYYRNREARTKEENFAPFEKTARGEYLQWLMQDDILEPEKIARMAEVLRTQPDVTLVMTERGAIDVAGRELPDRATPVHHFPIPAHQTVVYSGESIGHLMLSHLANVVGEPPAALFRRQDLTHHYWRAESRGYLVISDVAMWLELLEKGHLYVFKDHLSWYRISSFQEGRKLDVIVLSRLEWFRLATEYYRRRRFLTEAADYYQALELLYRESSEWQQKQIGRAASPELWQRYEKCMEKIGLLLRAAGHSLKK